MTDLTTFLEIKQNVHRRVMEAKYLRPNTADYATNDELRTRRKRIWSYNPNPGRILKGIQNSYKGVGVSSQKHYALKTPV